MDAKTPTFVDANEVVGEPLPEMVGSVTRDPVRGRPLDQPLASEREVDDDGGAEITHRGHSLQGDGITRGSRPDVLRHQPWRSSMKRSRRPATNPPPATAMSGTLDGPSRTIEVEPVDVPVPASPPQVDPGPARQPDGPSTPERPREPAH
jgi:hypothetical protein